MSVAPGLDHRAAERAVRLALEEDAPFGDLTSATFLPADASVDATLTAREPGVLSGEQVFALAMEYTDASIKIQFHCHDGDRFEPGAMLATVAGPARAVLQAERIALNFIQRMSGIATLTARFVAEIAGTGARIVDTRKTTPGLRALERYAVRCGGGHNHRFSLSDAVMLKDNHLAVLTASHPGGLREAVQEAKLRLPHTTHVEIEVDRLDQIEEVLAAGADTVMLDNFSLADMATGVRLIAGRALVEASGNMSLDRVRAVAATGVDIISVGALTHSVRALDLGLDISTDPAPPSTGQA